MSEKRPGGGGVGAETRWFPQQTKDGRLAPSAPDQPVYYLLLPPAPPVLYRRSATRCSILFSSLSLLFILCLLSVTVFVLWPSDPRLDVLRLELDHVRVSTKSPAPPSLSGMPSVYLDILMNVTIRVSNPDFFGVNYRSVAVSIGYRGKDLGFVTSEGGDIRARGVSYIDAALDLDGIQVLQDAIYLLEDLARGSIPFESLTDLEGELNLSFFQVPLRDKQVNREQIM
ncbi:hypothetical protein EJ110_NYTH01253 [Nymphaea thermarum]|nr:hypothetical protein EJ110_NYTH01253 [Nymphaea thermarum]